MAQDLSIARSFLSKLSPGNKLDPLSDLSLTYDTMGPLRICYAPFDHIATGAKLVVVGITPGLTQAVAALAVAQEDLRQGRPLEEALRRAKLTASFSGGAMRNNLVAMLDAVGVHDLLRVPTASVMFAPGAELVHFTSALRYPVFVNGANYNGTPDMLRTPILRRMIETHLAEEARALPNALWLPLGPKAEAAVLYLVKSGLIERGRVLAGMPHPSGANAERVAVFVGRKDPSLASRQTNATALLSAFLALKAQIGRLTGVAA